MAKLAADHGMGAHVNAFLHENQWRMQGSVKVDLHCHTTASDGSMAPHDLLTVARANGVELLAITDHDTLAGYHSACKHLRGGDFGVAGFRLLSGIELSCGWLGQQTHVVGLGFNPDCPVFIEALKWQQQARHDRAATIALRLEKKLNRTGMLAAVQAIAGEQSPARPHFAEYMVREGLVKNVRQAFDRYLGNGKLGDVSSEWPAIAVVVEWIKTAGGVAVLAHPESYALTRTRLARLAAEFAAAGGQAMEMAARQHTAQVTTTVAEICRQAGLAASIGSDFHGAEQAWRKLGSCAPIPAGLTPVWELPELAADRIHIALPQ